MPRVEAPITTTTRFLESWQTGETDPNRLVAELVSLQKETHRRPDIYHFEANNSQLIDPETKRPILEFIAPGIEKDIAEELQEWAIDNESGSAYWISPKSDEYPCNKLILHQIAYTGDNEKVVMNTAILFDGDLDNPEELRRQFIQTDDEGLAEIITWIEDYTGKTVTGTTYTQFERQQAQYYAQQLENGVPYEVIARQMEEDNFIGNNPISCPTAVRNVFSNIVSSRANVINLTETKILCCTCPECGKEVEAEIYDGKIHCPKCNAEANWSN